MHNLKFLSLVLAAAVSVIGQGVQIGAPAPGSAITPGTNFTVEVDKPESLTPSEDVAIVIGLRSCTSTPVTCTAGLASDDLGIILYEGPYTAQFSNDTNHKPPHENFTFTVPSSLPTGGAVLAVVHLGLVEAGPHVLFETVNITLTVN